MGGVVGDDGVDNIVLGPEEPEGQVYSEFQRYVKEHKQIGVILNINSKMITKMQFLGSNIPTVNFHRMILLRSRQIGIRRTGTFLI